MNKLLRTTNIETISIANMDIVDVDINFEIYICTYNPVFVTTNLFKTFIFDSIENEFKKCLTK
jgi:hypothetical protein